MLKIYLNSSLPFRREALKFCLPYLVGENKQLLIFSPHFYQALGWGGGGDAQTKNHSVEGVWIYFLEQHNPDVKILLTDLFASLVTLKDALTL